MIIQSLHHNYDVTQVTMVTKLRQTYDMKMIHHGKCPIPVSNIILQITMLVIKIKQVT
jgi:hypothetical protein